MSEYVKFPISIRQVVTAGTTVEIVNEIHYNPNGTAMNLTGYTFLGQVRTTADSTGTLLGTIDFTGSTLASGIILGEISASDATAIEAGATEYGPDGVTREAYFDVLVTDALSKVRCWYAGTLPVRKAVSSA